MSIHFGNGGSIKLKFNKKTKDIVGLNVIQHGVSSSSSPAQKLGSDDKVETKQDTCNAEQFDEFKDNEFNAEEPIKHRGFAVYNAEPIVSNQYMGVEHAMKQAPLSPPHHIGRPMASHFLHHGGDHHGHSHGLNQHNNHNNHYKYGRQPDTHHNQAPLPSNLPPQSHTLMRTQSTPQKHHHHHNQNHANRNRHRGFADEDFVDNGEEWQQMDAFRFVDNGEEWQQHQAISPFKSSHKPQSPVMHIPSKVPPSLVNKHTKSPPKTITEVPSQWAPESPLNWNSNKSQSANHNAEDEQYQQHDVCNAEPMEAKNAEPHSFRFNVDYKSQSPVMPSFSAPNPIEEEPVPSKPKKTTMYLKHPPSPGAQFGPPPPHNVLSPPSEDMEMLGLPTGLIYSKTTPLSYDHHEAQSPHGGAYGHVNDPFFQNQPPPMYPPGPPQQPPPSHRPHPRHHQQQQQHQGGSSDHYYLSADIETSGESKKGDDDEKDEVSVHVDEFDDKLNVSSRAPYERPGGFATFNMMQTQPFAYPTQAQQAAAAQKLGGKVTNQPPPMYPLGPPQQAPPSHRLHPRHHQQQQQQPYSAPNPSSQSYTPRKVEKTLARRRGDGLIGEKYRVFQPVRFHHLPQRQAKLATRRKLEREWRIRGAMNRCPRPAYQYQM